MPQKNLTIMSMNVGRMLQPRTRAFIERLAHDPNVPDVLCLQDIPYRDLSLFERWPYVTFGPMTNHIIGVGEEAKRAVVGIAVASRYFLTDIAHHTYWGDGTLKDLQGIKDNQRHLGEESDRLVEATEDRLVICASVEKEGVGYDLANTHGMWVRGGVTNDVQRQSMKRLRDILADEAQMRDGIVLASDLNFGRGGEIYDMFTEWLADRMPPEIDHTLDPEHPVSKKGIKVVSDHIMSCPEFLDSYLVNDVKLHLGVSDHAAISATIEVSF